ncbi:flagellar filament capping protein FliD [Paenibacillus macerans]|uniref:Flagellar hook-associated protein 2 n=1 Tax=Paenibacillus macerans TaxID=44252 RepID=A0A6N8EV04_PAEMA|nr:flagellar filament capping protein FliD [Paenibacillus macerans]MUG23699.1 flagellar filament capping protein FliD [Paenibacillus macerans]
MRVTGLASGMDIDSLVQNMMKGKRAPLDKLIQQKQTLEWKRDYYKEINSQLVDFRNNKLWGYKKEASLNPYKSVVTGDTNAVSVKATPKASQVDMTIEVDRLASQRSKTSVDSLGIDVTKRSTLSSLDPSRTDDKYVLTITRPGNDPVNLEFSKSDTIESVIRKINSDTKANVTAALDEATGKITLKSKEYGNQNVTFEGSLTEVFKLTGAYEGGVTSQVKVNGQSLEYASNTFTLNGVEITLLGKTETDKPAVVSTKTDSDTIVETIKSFIKDYNAVLEKINGKLNEERFRKFPPLTDEQKKEMKEDDIKRWEEKAKSGLLRNDEILTGAVWNMREAVVTSGVEGTTINLSSIGITTGQYYENGKLILDEQGEAKLRKAVEENPDQVLELFIGSDGTGGLFNKLYDDLAGPLEAISERAGTDKYSTSLTYAYDTESVMGKELKDVNQRISDLQKKLTDMETRYYSQFTAMEKAINKLNAQTQSITSMLSQ